MMNDGPRTQASDRDGVIAVLRELGELIVALDRRVPHVERVGEIRIAQDAAALREEALARLEELQRVEPDRQTREAELSNAVMSDDGGGSRSTPG